MERSHASQLIESLRAIAEDQVRLLENVVVGQGEWRLTEQHNGIAVSKSRWFSNMSENTKKLHMRKVFIAKSISSLSTEDSTLGTSSTLNVSVEDSGITTVAQAALQGIWAKAEKLVQSAGHIIKAPSVDDEMARLVKSSSGPQPHLVTRDPKKKDVFVCDKSCPMFRSVSICAHVVATVEVNRCLQPFLNEISRLCKLNLSAIAMEGMPSGAGRKGGVQKYKRTPKAVVETRSVRHCLEESRGEQGDESTSPMLNSVQNQMPILPPNSSFAELTSCDQ